MVAPRYPARKHPLGGRLVGWLITSSLRRHFRRVLIERPPRLDDLPREWPLLYLVSHVAWWDGYLMYVVNRRLGRDGYLMMDERQLTRYGFFRWVGCFSVDRQHPRRALAAVHYAAELLTSAPNRSLVLFPQGQIRPNDQRPLQLETGVVRLLRRLERVAVVPVALRYEYRDDQHALACASLGEPWLLTAAARDDGRAVIDQLTARLTAQMDGLRDCLARDDLGTFETVLQGSSSVNDVYDRLRRLIPRRWLGRRP